MKNPTLIPALNIDAIRHGDLNALADAILALWTAHNDQAMQLAQRIGSWQDITFNAADFTASGGAWTLQAADKITFASIRVDNALIVTGSFVNTDIGANSDFLQITIPFGLLAQPLSRSLGVTHYDLRNFTTFMSDDFESYAVGHAALAAVWTTSGAAVVVQAAVGVGGSKAVFAPNGQAMERTTGGVSTGFDVTCYAKRSSAVGARGVSMQLSTVTDPDPSYNLFGFYESDVNGDTTVLDGHLTIFASSSEGSIVLTPPFVDDVRTTPAVIAYVPNVFQKFRMVGRCSTPNADAQDLNADGAISVYVDDVYIGGLTNVKVSGGQAWMNAPGVANTWTHVYFSWANGYIDNVIAKGAEQIDTGNAFVIDALSPSQILFQRRDGTQWQVGTAVDLQFSIVIQISP